MHTRTTSSLGLNDTSLPKDSLERGAAGGGGSEPRAGARCPSPRKTVRFSRAGGGTWDPVSRFACLDLGLSAAAKMLSRLGW